EAEVALLHDVEQGQTRRLILLRDRDDQPEVRVHELAVRLLALPECAAQLAALGRRELLGGLELGARLVAGLDRLREPDFVVLREEIVAAHVLQVEADEVLVVTVLAAGLRVLHGHFFGFRRAGGRWVWRAVNFGRALAVLYRREGDAGRATLANAPDW